MSAAGVYSLGDFVVTSSATYVGDWIENLDGMLAMTAQLRFQFGANGTSVRAFLQVSLDQGVTAVDIACVLFGVASEVAILNFSGLTPKLTGIVPTDGALSDDSSVDGILSDRVRLKLVSTGVYSGQTVLSGRISAR